MISAGSLCLRHGDIKESDGIELRVGGPSSWFSSCKSGLQNASYIAELFRWLAVITYAGSLLRMALEDRNNNHIPTDITSLW